METTPSTKNDTKPLGFGQTMLASAVGFIIGTVALSIISFIFLMVMLVSMLSSSSTNNSPISGKDIAVELDITGVVAESQPNELMTLFNNNTGTSISQLLCAIENAATDNRVNALYLHLAGSNLSWAQAEELQEALKSYRNNCNKPIIAYGETYSQPEYFLATTADMIAIHPSGIIDFRGIGAEVMFYKGLLDKLGVHMELIRPTSCAYKSAGEV